MIVVEARCGTESGYGRHQRRSEKPCDACTAAKREYDRRWRQTTDSGRRGRLFSRAQSRALSRLAAMYPAMYAALYAEEKARAFADAEQADQ